MVLSGWPLLNLLQEVIEKTKAREIPIVIDAVSPAVWNCICKSEPTCPPHLFSRPTGWIMAGFTATICDPRLPEGHPHTERHGVHQTVRVTGASLRPVIIQTQFHVFM